MIKACILYGTIVWEHRTISTWFLQIIYKVLLMQTSSYYSSVCLSSNKKTFASQRVKILTLLFLCVKTLTLRLLRSMRHTPSFLFVFTHFQYLYKNSFHFILLTLYRRVFFMTMYMTGNAKHLRGNILQFFYFEEMFPRYYTDIHVKDRI